MRLYLALVFATLAFPALAADHYEFDKEHTTIMFHVNHLGYSDMVGIFKDFSGSFRFDPAHPGDSSIDVILRPSGIRTSSSALDKVLQGEKFFNSDKFPEIHFVSTGITVTGPRAGDVAGNLTMLGVTKPITLHVRFNKADYFPMINDFVAGFSADAALKRSDFGMSYTIPLVADEVRIEIQTEGINIDRKNAEKIQHR